ncbi:MAG: aminoacyl-tRNA hydrolase [Ignavibacteriales bacterium]|nr:MAG: aminoacyl-tRNA hydrolase [Ignavibacteriales bacterium]
MLRAIIGLGNPGKKYEFTRHNVGFLLLDYIAAQNKLTFKSENDYLIAKGELDNSPFLFIKPTTYMNLSGEAVVYVKEKFNIDLDNLLIVHDDLDLSLGKIKIKLSGSDGGHNGIASIIYHLYSNKFPRLRIGIGRDFSDKNIIDYVLGEFSSNEDEVILPVFAFCRELVYKFLEGGTKRMLDFYSSQYNKE